ncbi:hypothetical protein U0038_17530 [Sphingobacterium spiritivorum]|uniref:Phage minor structural protein GP20 n=1 Tax=Sphingobacterium spiritivorum ATCC 33861 TaxID=525373 RepID=D7VN54_SPHSI|nr:hypothetical protein [Sphingobacterium spiritivorum]EFK57351.1 hypothetical protein HMPREF0766_12424 [Sphingobacterium spiritivorum ATCC 33861]QQT36569.1 hypothetical protein I6J01_03820 [Sphingobacterium spiritivorum]WQD33320.1 hypothetical protein U0038_17530 [Sphingobacterium spiritivorum]SUJ22077.1 Uncharacterised protein [Sphingobacterium spiritivorum]
MNIKELIKTLLQSNFGGAQLSDARVEQLAKRLEGKVTTEDELKEKLSLLNELEPFSEKVKEDDRMRSFQSEIEKLKKGAGQSDDKDKGDEGAGGSGAASGAGSEEIPAWAKAIIDGNKTVTEKLAALEGQKVVNDRRSIIQAKLKDADKDYSSKVLRDFGRMNFATDEDFTAYLTDVETDFANHTQTQAESKLGKDNPFAGVGKDGKITEASQAEVDKLFGDIKI